MPAMRTAGAFRLMVRMHFGVFQVDGHIASFPARDARSRENPAGSILPQNVLVHNYEKILIRIS